MRRKYFHLPRFFKHFNLRKKKLFFRPVSWIRLYDQANQTNNLQASKNTIRKLDISNNLDRIVSVATFMGKLFIFLIQIIDYRF